MTTLFRLRNVSRFGSIVLNKSGFSNVRTIASRFSHLLISLYKFLNRICSVIHKCVIWLIEVFLFDKKEICAFAVAGP